VTVKTLLPTKGTKTTTLVLTPQPHRASTLMGVRHGIRLAAMCSGSPAKRREERCGGHTGDQRKVKEVKKTKMKIQVLLAAAALAAAPISAVATAPAAHSYPWCDQPGNFPPANRQVCEQMCDRLGGAGMCQSAAAPAPPAGNNCYQLTGFARDGCCKDRLIAGLSPC
jgi:hypothetical protein